MRRLVTLVDLEREVRGAFCRWWNDWAKSADFMENSVEFKSGPIGKFVDPAKMVTARKGGMSIEEVHQKAYYEGAFVPAVLPDFRIEM